MGLAGKTGRILRETSSIAGMVPGKNRMVSRGILLKRFF
jgi:hypothetical protein